jgi:hypothetical protein
VAHPAEFGLAYGTPVPGYVAPPERAQHRIGVLERRRVVTGAGMPHARGRAQLYRGSVDLVLAQREPVADRCAGDDRRAQPRASMGDENLQRLPRAPRRRSAHGLRHRAAGGGALAGRQPDNPGEG